MAAISQQIPNLLGGVSQQPDPLKLPGQVKEAKNVFLDPTFGCKKRPPLKFITQLDTDIPSDAKWIPIVRDELERYVIAIYKDASNATVIRVWEADTGTERAVTVLGDSANYLTVNNPNNIKTLTVNDYTFLCNSESVVTMSENTPEAGQEEGLVVINQVAYNTTYSIDFLKDGQQTTQEKVYRASKLTVSPGSFVDETNGNCLNASSQSFVEDGSGNQTGLGFTITTNCTPTLVTTEGEGSTYPTALSDATAGYGTYGLQGWATKVFGQANNHARGSYLYHTFTVSKPPGDITVRAEVRVDPHPSNDDWNVYRALTGSIINYTTTDDPVWSTEAYVADFYTLSSDLARYPDDQLIMPAGSIVGIRFKVSSVQTSTGTPTYDYKSSYSSKVRLNNGGQNWRVGDSVTVEMANKNYTITVEREDFGFNYASEAQVSHTTPANAENGTLDVGSITAALVSEINLLADYSATPIGNIIHIERTDGREFNIQTRGGTTNNALYGIKNSVNDITMLPNQCVPGVVLKVRNTAESDADDYYVKFIAASGDIPGQGSWEETVLPGIVTDLNSSTMPHALIREASGEFTVRPLSEEYDDALFWAGREVGDEGSNPVPSFVDRTIQDLVFYMNRLGFLSEDAIVLSQPGDYFNFFASSAIAVSDADPIDMNASATKPAILKAALGTAKGLLLFAENSQFLLAADDTAFGPSTAKMTEIASYAYTSNIPPVETGVSVLFSTEADTFSKVFEMAVDSVDNRPLVSENTRIVPEYIPPNLILAASSANNSFVAFGDGSPTLYTFKFFNVGNERSLAGWSKWEMPCDVRLFTFTHDTGFLVLRNGDASILTRLEILDDPDVSPISAYGSKFLPRLDNYLYPDDIVIEAGVDKTKLRFPDGAWVNKEEEPKTPCVIFTAQGTATTFGRPEIQEDATGYYVEVENDIATYPFVLGIEYDMEIDLPTFYVKDDKKADRRNPVIVENAYIDLYLSGRYEVILNRLGYVPRHIDLEVTTADVYLANSPAIDDVSTRAIPVYCQGDYANITIKASDPLPASITSYSWEGHYSTRGIKLVPQ